MADENKKYTNRLRDKSTNEVYFVYDEEALHADSSISLLTNDAGYVKNSELDELVARNTAFVKPAQLMGLLAPYATTSSLSQYVRQEDLDSLAISGEILTDYSSEANFDVSNTRWAFVDQNTSYKVANAINIPTGTGRDGILSVRKLDSGSLVKEEWNTKTGKADRLVEFSYATETRWTDGSISAFDATDPKSYFVNALDAYYLNAGGTYVLHGAFNKRIIVSSFTKVSDTQYNNLAEVSDSNVSTTLVLTGCFFAPNGETAIDYPSKYGQLALSIHGTNAIVIDSENISGELSPLNEHELRSTAAIYSKSNLFFGGNGVLSLTSNVKNHAIKADNVSIKDYIQLYVDLQGGHDGINIGDNHRVLISDGHLTFKNCHNAIDGGIDGIVNILGGTIVFEDNDVDIDCSDCSKAGRIFDMMENTFVDTENSLNIIVVNPFNVRTIYGSPIVASEDGSTTYNADSNGVYTINTNGVTLSGYFNNRQIYITGSSDNPNKSIDIYLEDAYIENHERKTTSGKGQTILYSPETGKLAVRCKEGTVNFVTQTQESDTGDGYGAIKSKNNLTIQGAGSLYVRSTLSDAIDGSNVIIKGNGFRYFESLNDETADPKGGICGKSITIGEDDDATDLDAENSFQTIFTKSIIAKKNKNNEKGIIDILKYQIGLIMVMADPVAETSIANELGESTLNPLVYYLNLPQIGALIVENRFENVITRRIDTATPWNIFISATEVDNKIAQLLASLNETIAALQARVTKLEHKHLVYHPATAPTDYTDGNIEYWYCPECDEYYTDEEALHQVTRQDVIIPRLIQDESPVDSVDDNGNIVETEAYDSNGNPVQVDAVENN